MRLPSRRVQPPSSCAARVESMVLVPTLHALGHSPSHLWQKMLRTGTGHQPRHRRARGGRAAGNTHPHPHTPQPAFIPGVARGTLGEALPLVDDEFGGVAGVVGDLAEAGAVLGGDAAPALVLVGAGGAGGQAVPVEVEVTAGDAGSVVAGSPAAPQALGVAAFARRRARRAHAARAHCGRGGTEPVPWARRVRRAQIAGAGGPGFARGGEREEVGRAGGGC